MPRALRLIALSAAAIYAMASCQQGVEMFAACSPASNGDRTGTDGEFVLVCDDGIWQPVMTVDEYVQIVQGENPTIASVPTAPTTTTTTSTTTTTIVPAATLAIAYSNVDGDAGYDAANGDRLIAKLVDTNQDDVVSVGDTVTFADYPADAAMSQFYSFTNTVHLIDNVDTASTTAIRVGIEAGTNVTWEAGDASEKIIEGDGDDDDIFIQDRYLGGAGGDLIVTGDGSVGGETPVDVNTGGAGVDQDYLDVDITL